MPTKVVYVSNMAGHHDYEPAKRYGGLRPVTSGNYPIFKTERLLEEIADAFAASTPDDYLLLSGSSVVAGLCMSIWLLQHGKVNLLLYDKAKGQYVVRETVRNDLMVEIEKARDRAQNQEHSGVVR